MEVHFPIRMLSTGPEALKVDKESITKVSSEHDGGMGRQGRKEETEVGSGLEGRGKGGWELDGAKRKWSSRVGRQFLKLDSSFAEDLFLKSAMIFNNRQPHCQAPFPSAFGL